MAAFVFELFLTTFCWGFLGTSTGGSSIIGWFLIITSSAIVISGYYSEATIWVGCCCLLFKIIFGFLLTSGLGLSSSIKF